MHNIKKINPLIIYQEEKKIELIKKINKSKIKIIFVLDRNKRLTGSITSGDLRRFLTKKINYEAKVSQIMNRKVKFFYEKDKHKIQTTTFTKSIFCIPIVNNQKKILYFKLKKNLEVSNKKNIIFLLAGGKGVRLYPLTKNNPKPMLKIKNKTIIEKIINNFKEQGFCNFVISVNYLKNKIKNFLKNGKNFDVKIKYIEENSYLGTAGPLSLLNCKDTELPVIVTNSDLVSSIDYENLLNYHIKQKADITICSKNKIFVMPYGELLLKKYNVKKIIEKPTTSSLVNAGIYVINANLFTYLKKNKKIMMNDFINHLITSKKKVITYPIFENWIDIGNKLDLVKAKKNKF